MFLRVAPADGLVGCSGAHDVDGGGDEGDTIIACRSSERVGFGLDAGGMTAL